MKKFAAPAAVCLLLILAHTCLAKDWNGVFPLHTSREFVEIRFGKPSFSYAPRYFAYWFDDDTVFFEFAQDSCDNGQPPFESYYAPEDAVLTITVFFGTARSLREHRIPNLGKLKKLDRDTDGTVDYFDEAEGVSYAVKNEKVDSVTYGPSAGESYLRCSKLVTP